MAASNVPTTAIDPRACLECEESLPPTLKKPCRLSQHHLEKFFNQASEPGKKGHEFVATWPCPKCGHDYDQHDANWQPPAAAQAAPPADLAELLQRQLAFEEKRNNEKFFVRYRLWNDARMVGPIGCPLQALYSTARERFPFTHIRLYLLPDPRDFHSRVHISEEDPWQYSNLLRGGNPVLYVWSQEHGHSLPASPDRVPEPEPAVLSSHTASSRGVQQETFRRHVVELFGDSQDYLTGEKIGGTTPGEAAHIIPVNKTAGAAKTIDDKVLLMAKLEAPTGLYTAANGIPLFPIFHKAFDRFQVSINPDEDYRIHVFGKVPPELRRLDGQQAAGRGKQVIGHHALLRWHFQQARERHAPRTPAPRARKWRSRKKRGASRETPGETPAAASSS